MVRVQMLLLTTANNWVSTHLRLRILTGRFIKIFQFAGEGQSGYQLCKSVFNVVFLSLVNSIKCVITLVVLQR